MESGLLSGVHPPFNWPKTVGATALQTIGASAIAIWVVSSYVSQVHRPLLGKSIVVIGGTTGLGRSAALAARDAGARVVVVGRTSESLSEMGALLGESGESVLGDAIEVGTAERAITRCLERFGGFDGLYHVAGGSGRRRGDGLLHELTEDGWQFTQDLNLKSVFLSNRAAVRQFLHQGSSGSVLNCGSVLGFSPSPQFFGTHAYATAKAGIIGLTRSAAATYAKHGIRFNVVAPALVATPMSQRAQSNDAIQSFIKTKQPLDGGRMGVPEDLDAAVVWLLSDESRFVTGQVIAIDGGWSHSEGQFSPLP